MREYSEYVIDKFNEWNKKYDIPEYFEFQLKTMFELEEQFREQPKENVKTKQDILGMIQDLHSRMQFKIKPKGVQDINLNIKGELIGIEDMKKQINDLAESFNNIKMKFNV